MHFAQHLTQSPARPRQAYAVASSHARPSQAARRQPSPAQPASPTLLRLARPLPRRQRLGPARAVEEDAIDVEGEVVAEDDKRIPVTVRGSRRRGCPLRGWGRAASAHPRRNAHVGRWLGRAAAPLQAGPAASPVVRVGGCLLGGAPLQRAAPHCARCFTTPLAPL